MVNSITGAPLSGVHLKLALENPDEIVALVYGASGDPLTVELGTAGARIAGTVSDANGPIAGALVALFPEGRYATELRLIARAGSDGRYSIRGLAPGKYAGMALPSEEPEAIAQYDQKIEKIELREGDAILKDLKVILGR